MTAESQRTGTLVPGGTPIGLSASSSELLRTRRGWTIGEGFEDVGNVGCYSVSLDMELRVIAEHA